MPAPKDPIRYKEWIEENRIRTTELMKDPAMRERIAKGQRGRKHTKEHNEKIAKSGTGIIRWPNGRPEMKGNKNPSCRQDVRLKKSLKTLGIPRPQCSRPGALNPMFGKRASESTKLKMSVSHQGNKCHMWKGGISFEPYCIKFSREFKQRVRAFFNFTCQECGTIYTGRTLHVHHVQFNKQTCCDDSTPLFIALCNSCHSKTQTNRDYWERYYSDMIKNYYSGKCYLTREEYVCLNS